MPSLKSPAQAERLRSFFTEAGYAEENLRRELGLVELPSARLRNLPRLLDRTGQSSLLNALLRWFWIGVPQPERVVAPLLPAWFTEVAVTCGLLRRQDEQLFPEVMFLFVEDLLVASDLPAKIEAGDRETVLWPNPTTRLLLRFAIRRESRKTLDLGTGTGALALKTAAYSRQVVATDLNPRAVDFARFNALLNGIENVECLRGDGFQPVTGRKFDLIVSNPPFFITPGNQYLFCDNPMDLDGLCRSLVQQAPAHLEPGGYFQMLCEWAEIGGQDWHERLKEWFRGSDCDAWVLKGSTVDPSEYAQERITETTSLAERDASLYRQYMDYYRRHRVEAIHKGMIVMRFRPGQNWILMEDLTDAPREAFGDSIERRFTARDFLAVHATDQQMLEVRPRLSPDVRLEQIFEPGAKGWQPATLTLKLTRGFRSTAGVQPLVAEFLSGCTGEKTLRELIGDLAPRVNATPERVSEECLGVIRKLIESDFVHW